MADRSATGKLKISIDCTIKNTLNTSQAAQVSQGFEVLNKAFTDGVNDSQFNRGWCSLTRTLAANASETIDLYDFAGIDIGAGSGNDALGLAMTMEEICVLIIKQISGTGRLEINPSYPAAPVPWIGQQTVANGGALHNGGARVWGESDTDGLNITDGVAHQLTVRAYDGTVTYAIGVYGRHDDDESSSSSSSSSSSTSTSQSSSSQSTSTTTSMSSSSTSSASSSSSSTSSFSSPSSQSSSSRSTSSSVNSSSSSTSSVNSSSSSTSTTSASSSSSSSTSSTSS